MKVKMINGNDIQCVVTEEEIRQYGLEMNDIFSNTGKAQSFLNEILDLVEEETGCVVGDGAKTVQAVCLPGNAVALTFSDRESAEFQEEASLLPEKKLEVLGFGTITEAIAFTRSLDFTEYDRAKFCKEKEIFYLIVDLTGSSAKKIDHFFAAAFEYARTVEEDEWRASYLEEHATVLIGQHAMHVLAGL